LLAFGVHELSHRSLCLVTKDASAGRATKFRY
jgi:hypothetical protein